MALMLFCLQPAMAGRPANVTPGELALLPMYCPDTQGFNYGDAVTNTSPRAPYWVSRLGQGFWAVHHHCWALVKVRRAMLPGTAPEIRKGLLEEAVDDYYYVVRNTPPNFLLLPDVFMKIGDTHMLQGQIALASEAYAKSRALKADFWPVYIQWARALNDTGNRKAALAHLEEGMRASPATKELQGLYTQWGGNAQAFLASIPVKLPGSAASASAEAPPADIAPGGRSTPTKP